MSWQGYYLKLKDERKGAGKSSKDLSVYESMLNSFPERLREAKKKYIYIYISSD